MPSTPVPSAHAHADEAARRRGGLGAALVDLAPALAVAGLIWVLSSLPLQAPAVAPDGSDLVAHAVLFGALAAALHRAWRRRGWPRPRVVPWALTAVYGAVDELHQAFVPGRAPDPVDLVADAIGATLALAALALIARRRTAAAP